MGSKRRRSRLDAARSIAGHTTYKIVLDDGFYVLKDEFGERIPKMPPPNTDKELFIESLKPHFSSPCIQAFKEGYMVVLPD